MRKLSVLFLSLIVLFLFFAGFYLYYVPSNKSSLNKYGFLILQQLESALQYKAKANKNLYANYVGAAFGAKRGHRSLDKVGYWLNRLGVDSVMSPGKDLKDGGEKNQKDGSGRRVERKGGTVRVKEDSADGHRWDFRNRMKTGVSKVEGQLSDIRNDRLYYLFQQGTDSIELTIPVTQFLGDLLGSHPNDFFQSFVFLKIEGHNVVTVYKNEGLSIGREIETDTLFRGSRDAFYPGITDIHAGAQDVKLFYIPVELDNQRYVLCGIKDAAEYAEGAHAVPAGFIYPIVITLLLLLIVSPLIKLYIMGPAEKVRLQDFTGYCFSLVAGSMLVTLIIIQILLLKDGDTWQDRHLHSLSDQIGGAFQQELKRAYGQLQAIDSLPLRPDARGQVRDPQKSPFDISGELVAYMRAHRESSYYNFDRAAWVNDSGQQVVTASIDRNLDTLFVDVSRRKYFTDFKNNSCYPLPGVEGSLVSIQPVVTWTEGVLRVLLAKRSSCPGVFITTLSTDMYSINRTILPSGFGYCLIDAEGRVQVHSDPSHSLNENFINEVEDAAALKSAMTARQELYLPETKFYGREYGLLVEPVQNMPYFLVSFYDKGYIQPVNMRILIFSLAGCLFSLLICAAIWLLFFRRRWNDRPLLFRVLDYLPWIVPRPSLARAYFTGWIVVGGYVIVLVGATLLALFYTKGNNQSVLIFLLLTPLLLTGGIYGIGRWCSRPYKRAVNYLLHYSLLVETLVLGLGVLPAALFTWYANNQELLQSVKKEQLLMAYSLQNRQGTLYQSLQQIDSTLVTPGLFVDWQYRQGIYRLNDERLMISREALPPADEAFGVVQTYFDIAAMLANNYYDPEFVPVLEGRSTDGRWQWAAPDSGKLKFYYAMSPDTHEEEKAEKGPARVLGIESIIPDRYIYLSDFGKAFFVIGMVFLLLWGLYKLVEKVSGGMFLQKFIRVVTDKKLPLIETYCVKECLRGEAKVKRVAEMEKVIFANPFPGGSEEEMDKEEMNTLHCIRDWGGYFGMVLDSCNAKEKYLLYQFACNGFLNYKNIVEIDDLLQRGILRVEEEEVMLFSRCFRAYILTNVHEDELEKSFIRRNPWQSFRMPFLILLLVAASFLFFTRQEAWQRIAALLAALSTSLGLLKGLFAGAFVGKPDTRGKGDKDDGDK